MRQLASIRTIGKLTPIPGADRIETAAVDGWECVVKKGEFSPGEKIVYVEVDSVLPERPEFESLRSRKFRVRTVKLKGQISQGLVLPLSVLPAYADVNLGADVTDVLGITKYDPEAQQEAALASSQTSRKKLRLFKPFMRFAWFRKLTRPKRKTADFPDWIAKTDETRIQNLPELFEYERDRGTFFMVTEKMDGQSATYFLRKKYPFGYEFGVCSRNMRLLVPDDSSYWTVARQYNIKRVLKKLIRGQKSVILQGEICGPMIQKNKYDLNKFQLFAFNLQFPDHFCDTKEIAIYLAPHGISTVPILDTECTLPSTISELVESADGRSLVNSKQRREGVVMRNMVRGISFKVLNPYFLLDEKE